MNKKLLKELYEATIQQIQAIKNLTIEYDMLNEQEWINFQDKLNELSIDIDRN